MRGIEVNGPANIITRIDTVLITSDIDPSTRLLLAEVRKDAYRTLNYMKAYADAVHANTEAPAWHEISYKEDK